jgi:Transposase domain (DUF772)
MDHALVKLAKTIDWRFLEERLGEVYADGPGPPPLPTRLMAGLAILKSMHSLSDESLCERWLEDPYYQLFCGEDFFQHRLPFDRHLTDALAAAHGGRAADGAASGEPSSSDQAGGGQAVGLPRGIRRHPRAGKGHHLSDRRQADASRPRAAW